MTRAIGQNSPSSSRGAPACVEGSLSFGSTPPQPSAGTPFLRQNLRGGSSPFFLQELPSSTQCTWLDFGPVSPHSITRSSPSILASPLLPPLVKSLRVSSSDILFFCVPGISIAPFGIQKNSRGLKQLRSSRTRKK